MFRSSNFDKLLDKATSNLRLEPDWPAILQICDMIRQNDCTPKVAVASIKKKLFSPNPHQAMFALLTLESIVKNCGSGVHDEVASKAFCESLRDLVKTTQHENVRNKTLELVQAWAFAFRNSTKYTPVQDIVNILKAESFKFPPLKESDAMFSADTAPEWEDGEVCHRCRTGFTLLVRQHHCRACGKVFCQQCSSKTSTLPKFGIEKEVRVCDGCYEKACRPPSTSAKLEINDASDFGSTPTQKKPGKTAEELQEEEELQLALALSQSEAEQKEKDRRSRSQITPSTLSQVTATQSVNNSPDHNVSANSELSRYLDRGYWEQRQTTTSASAMPTAPVVSQTPSSPVEDFTKVTGKTPEEEAEDKEIDEFVSTLKSQVEIFVNRMKSDSSRGRPIANDTAVQSLFMNITAMHSRLLRYIQQQDDKRVYLESLQDKVTQIRDSRAALDTLRAEHSARLAAAAEAMERQRQMQMAAKLQAMRNKKHEYLQYQRQLALQRVQEQEREMQIRQEQQKHQYMMASNPGYYNAPGVSLPQFQPGYPTQHMYANPQMMPQTSEATSAIPNQPQGSQPMPMNQPMPQTNHPFPMGPVAGLPNNQAMMQQNIRPNAMAMQPQMMMQQMHQIRMANQSQQNGHKPQANPMMPPMSIPQQNMPPQINPNQMMGMQMPNMRMPMMQNNMQNPQATTGFNMANQPMMSNVQAPNHIPMQGQTLAQGQPITGQMQSVNMPTNVATSQTIPSNPQSSSQQQQNNTPQPVQMNNQVLRANQMNMQPQQMIQQGQTPQQFVTQPIPNHSQGQHIPGMNNFVNQPQQKLPNQMANQPQQVPSQMPQQVAGQQMQMTGQQMAQIPMQMPMQQQLPGQAVPQIGPQGQPIIQGQQIKVQAPQPNAPQQQQPPAQVKSENNNNTAELISFD